MEPRDRNDGSRNRGNGGSGEEQGQQLVTATVAMALADNRGNGGRWKRQWKQSQRRGQTTINQKAAAIAAETAVVVAVDKAVTVAAGAVALQQQELTIVAAAPWSLPVN